MNRSNGSATLVVKAENPAFINDFHILRLGHIYLSVGRVNGFGHVPFACYPCFDCSDAEIALLIQLCLSNEQGPLPKAILSTLTADISLY